MDPGSEQMVCCGSTQVARAMSAVARQETAKANKSTEYCHGQATISGPQQSNIIRGGQQRNNESEATYEDILRRLIRHKTIQSNPSNQFQLHAEVANVWYLDDVTALKTTELCAVWLALLQQKRRMWATPKLQ